LRDKVSAILRLILLALIQLRLIDKSA